MASKFSQPKTRAVSACPSLKYPSVAKHLEFVATGDLKPNPRNARTHSKKQIQQICDSIRKFGFNNPILVDDAYEVIAGHGRLTKASPGKAWASAMDVLPSLDEIQSYEIPDIDWGETWSSTVNGTGKAWDATKSGTGAAYEATKGKAGSLLGSAKSWWSADRETESE